MGLQEKRKIAEIKETVLPAIQQSLAEKIGATIEFSVDWNTIDTDSMKMVNDIVYYSKRHEEGLLLVASDVFGKEALIEAVKNIVLVHNPGKTRSLSLKEGTLTVSSTLADSLSYVYNIPGEFRKDLEKLL